MNSDDRRLVEKIRTESNEIAKMLNLPVPSQVKQLIEIVDWQDEALREAREIIEVFAETLEDVHDPCGWGPDTLDRAHEAQAWLTKHGGKE